MCKPSNVAVKSKKLTRKRRQKRNRLRRQRQYKLDDQLYHQKLFS